MQRRTKRIIGAIVVIAAIAAGGAAFTAGNTVPDTVAGYGTSNITGATVTALHYTLNADGTQITDASLTFQGDQTGNVVKAGFGTDSLTTCTVGSYDSGPTRRPRPAPATRSRRPRRPPSTWRSPTHRAT